MVSYVLWGIVFVLLPVSLVIQFWVLSQTLETMDYAIRHKDMRPYLFLLENRILDAYQRIIGACIGLVFAYLSIRPPNQWWVEHFNAVLMVTMSVFMLVQTLRTRRVLVQARSLQERRKIPRNDVLDA